MRKKISRKRTNTYITEDGKVFPYEGLAREHELKAARNELNKLEKDNVKLLIGDIKSFRAVEEKDLDTLKACYPSYEMYAKYELPVWLYLWNKTFISGENLKEIIIKELETLK